MIRRLSLSILLVFSAISASHADSSDWRVTEAPPTMSTSDRQMIGNLVCGKERFELTDEGLRCTSCPDFTGDRGADSGLEIGNSIRGRFTHAKADGEWVVDTAGCEAHFASFGGAILLGPGKSKIVPGSPAVALGSKLSAKSTLRPLSMSYYKPGFRLNDCLVFDNKDERNLLVCNEADMAQGEVIGHISVMEISTRGITRWRLLRWYDNSAANTSQIVSVVPVSMQRISPDGGQQRLHIVMETIETTRDMYEKAQKPPSKSVTLVYQRKGQRLFATAETMQLLGEINSLTRKMLE